VNFSQSVAELRDLRGTTNAQHPAQVQVTLPDGTPYAQSGTLDFSDLAVDPGTGAISLRAVVPNPDHTLLPGMFVNLQLTGGAIEHAFVLPQAAVSRDDAGAYALVVGADGKVAQRRLQSHGMTRSDWIVTGDLNEGDRVIVEGLQKVKPGGTATTVPAATPASGNAAPAH
jgi:membrane fusion protein (multidrug efflux system)